MVLIIVSGGCPLCLRQDLPRNSYAEAQATSAAAAVAAARSPSSTPREIPGCGSFPRGSTYPTFKDSDPQNHTLTVFGTKVLKHWVFGPSAFRGIQDCGWFRNPEG